MPKGTRGKIHRKLDQAMGNVDTAVEYIAECGAVMSGDYPQHEQGLALILNMLADVKEFIGNMKGAI